MNRYSPHYDHDEQRVIMSLDAEGGWVHINSVEARAVKAMEKRIEGLEAALREARTVIQWAYNNGNFAAGEPDEDGVTAGDVAAVAKLTCAVNDINKALTPPSAPEGSND